MKKNLIMLSSVVLASAPLMAFAQSAPTTCASYAQAGTIQYMICAIGNILSIVVPILIVLGVLFFVWGVITYVIASDEEAKVTGRNRMIYGIIGLVVIIGMWGLVGIVQRTFGINPGDANIPILVPQY